MHVLDFIGSEFQETRFCRGSLVQITSIFQVVEAFLMALRMAIGAASAGAAVNIHAGEIQSADCRRRTAEMLVINVTTSAMSHVDQTGHVVRYAIEGSLMN